LPAAFVAGVHWWYHTPSHAAELTAGYYNTSTRNGYIELLEVCSAYGADAVLTCVEMTDAQHPPDAACGPQALLNQVRQAAHTYGLSIAGVSARLACFFMCLIGSCFRLAGVH
jgi:beta-amylase